MKVVQNSPQNARNCTIFKNFLGGACPQTPLVKARSFAARVMYIQNHRNFKVGPPLRNPAYAPGYSIACPSITSSTASCLSATAKLHFLAITAS